MGDLNIRVERSLQELRKRIERLNAMMYHRRCTKPRRDVITAERNRCVIELHEHQCSASSYDRRLREAMDDPTGQDLDVFPFSE